MKKLRNFFVCCFSFLAIGGSCLFSNSNNYQSTFASTITPDTNNFTSYESRGTSSFDSFDNYNAADYEKLKYKFLDYNAGASIEGLSQVNYLNRYSLEYRNRVYKMNNKFTWLSGYYYATKPANTVNNYIMYEMHINRWNSVNGDRCGLTFGLPMPTFSENNFKTYAWQSLIEFTYNDVTAHYLTESGQTSATSIDPHGTRPYCLDNVTIYVVYQIDGKQAWASFVDNNGRVLANYYKWFDTPVASAKSNRVVGIGGNFSGIAGSYISFDELMVYDCDVQSGWTWSEILNSKTNGYVLVNTVNGVSTDNCSLGLTQSGAAISVEIETGLYHYNSYRETGVLYTRSGIDTAYPYLYDTDASEAGIVSNKSYGIVSSNFTILDAYSPQTSFHRKAFGLCLGQPQYVLDAYNTANGKAQYFNGNDDDGSFFGIYKEDDSSGYLKITALGRNAYLDVNDSHSSQFLIDRYLRYKKASGSHNVGDKVSLDDLTDKEFNIRVVISKCLNNDNVDIVLTLSNSEICESENPLAYLFSNLNPTMITGFAGIGTLDSSQEGTSSRHVFNRQYNKIHSFQVINTGAYKLGHSVLGTPIVMNNDSSKTYAFAIVCPGYRTYLKNDMTVGRFFNPGNLVDSQLFTGELANGNYWNIYSATDKTKSLNNTSGDVSLHTFDANNDKYYIDINSSATVNDNCQQIIYSSTLKLYFNYSTNKFVFGNKDTLPSNCTNDIQLMVYLIDSNLRNNFANNIDTQSSDSTFLKTWHTNNDMSCKTLNWYNDAKNALLTWGDETINHFQSAYYFNSDVSGSGAVDNHSLVDRYEEWARINGDGASPYSMTKLNNNLIFDYDDTAIVPAIIISILGLGALIVISTIIYKKHRKNNL